MPSDAPAPPGTKTAGEALALYVHWPFCLSKCPYCDFNSHVRDVIPQARFGNALRRELAHEAARTGATSDDRPVLGSIFFGGGTPSLMEPATLAALIEDAGRLFRLSPDIEITLEANPTSVETGRLRAFRDSGVNRISVGLQSLDPEALRFLGREHSVGQAIAALEQARALFGRISFDLIYARPGQSLASWRAELDQALGLVSDHLSLYQLTIEPGTRFESLYRQNRFRLPDDELAARLYEETASVAARHGLLGYEVSNYARPGAESRHNLTYWRYGDYLGIGPGAHGRVTLDGVTHATRRHRAPEPWAERVEQAGTGTTHEDALSPREKAREMLLMGLRLDEGIAAARFARRTGMSLEEATEPDILLAALEEGYLQWGEGGARLRATAEGRLRLESLLAALVV
ncbi:radical SAM family heme chaperone HemW [Novacetimonas maltaceti]|uniref:Heme chaperone HemW n=1 Tax=Novacetimonas maltaceti TaxID=1203393 RepID=A0A2S3W2A1_9PROT|nr:radical SAM family heme chaperone HemW [Novacetimonas maltaceti]POF63015.1 Oxygen-independent coproporphyrinogen-III oxidase 1 [Novacetimonas maltaceti]